LKELERALDLGAKPADVMPPLLEAKLEFGRYQEVLGELDQLDSSARVEAIRGRALLMSNDLPGAKAAFQRALDLEPVSPIAYLGLAQIALMSNDQQGAASLLARAVEVDPRSRKALLAQGDMLATQGQFDGALAAFTAAAQLPGTDLLPDLGVVRGNDPPEQARRSQRCGRQGARPRADAADKQLFQGTRRVSDSRTTPQRKPRCERFSNRCRTTRPRCCFSARSNSDRGSSRKRTVSSVDSSRSSRTTCRRDGCWLPFGSPVATPTVRWQCWSRSRPACTTLRAWPCSALLISAR
jgi:hypothetical protein